MSFSQTPSHLRGGSNPCHTSYNKFLPLTSSQPSGFFLLGHACFTIRVAVEWELKNSPCASEGLGVLFGDGIVKVSHHKLPRMGGYTKINFLFEQTIDIQEFMVPQSSPHSVSCFGSGTWAASHFYDELYFIHRKKMGVEPQPHRLCCCWIHLIHGSMTLKIQTKKPRGMTPHKSLPAQVPSLVKTLH